MEKTDVRAILNEHDPAQQPGNNYERCALCHYTRHPCDTYWVAEALLEALEHVEQAQIRYIEQVARVAELNRQGLDLENRLRETEERLTAARKLYKGSLS